MSRTHAAHVGERDAADLGIILAGDDDLWRRHDRAVAADELDAVLRIGDVVALRLGRRRLVARRPDSARFAVAQVEVGAPVVAGRSPRASA